MDALVTGCAGFIGSWLCERLIGDGWRVTGVDAFTDYYAPADKHANLRALRNEPRFELVTVDVATVSLAGWMQNRPTVFHLAAQPGVRGSFGDGFSRYVHDNIEATQMVFEAAVATGCPRVVWASSSSIYGNADTYPTIEGITPARPTSPYGATKRACEDLAAIYRSHGIETVGLRYFTVYGPRQRPDMAMRRLCETAAGGPRFVLNGDGAQTRDFTFVHDAVDATVRAATCPDPGAVLNIGGGTEASLNDVIGMIEVLAGNALDVERGPDQPGDVRRTGAETTLARDRLGWSPDVDLLTGLRSELDWVVERRPQIESAHSLVSADR